MGGEGQEKDKDKGRGGFCGSDKQVDRWWEGDEGISTWGECMCKILGCTEGYRRVDSVREWCERVGCYELCLGMGWGERARHSTAATAAAAAVRRERGAKRV